MLRLCGAKCGYAQEAGAGRPQAQGVFALLAVRWLPQSGKPLAGRSFQLPDANLPINAFMEIFPELRDCGLIDHQHIHLPCDLQEPAKLVKSFRYLLFGVFLET